MSSHRTFTSSDSTNMTTRTLDEPIELLDSDSDDGTVGAAIDDRETTIGSTPDPESVYADANDDDDDDDCAEIIPDEELLELQKRKATARQSLPIPPGHRHIRYFDLLGTRKIKAGTNVALVDGGYFRIKYLTHDKSTEEVSMHGWVLKSPHEMSNQMKKNTGELAIEIWTDEQDKRPDLERGIEELPLGKINVCVEKLTREIIFTNQKFPALRDWTKDFNNNTAEHWARGKLICRLKNIKFYSTKGGKVTKPIQEAWMWLTKEESDEEYGVSDISKTIDWRQGRDRDSTNTTRGGSYSESTASSRRQFRRSKTSNDDELVEIEESEYHEVTMKRTTTRLGSVALNDKPLTLKAADICCGAGGVSGGMDEAGFQVAVGVDSWHPAAETFRLNWPAPTTTTYEVDVSDFIISGEAARCKYCHVVHFSLPCQFFSPAHTSKEYTERDERNLDTNLATEEILKALRPMYATFENTSGLKEIDKHKKYFNILIKTLTDLGWNALFKVEKLSYYGNPQQRRRLIVIASCPGMPLIDFPLPTRGNEPGLLPPLTVGEAIRNIDRNDPLHNRKELRARLRQQPSKLPLAELNAPLRELINTSGPRALHPNGTRRFTYREGMRLMRFRDSHLLSPAAKGSGDKWRLIGNAVPRDIIVLIYKEIHKVLQKWFVEYNSPIVLDEEDSMAAKGRTRRSVLEATGSSSEPKRKRKADDLVELSDCEEEELPVNPLHPLGVPTRPVKRQRSMPEWIGVRKNIAGKPTAVKSEANRFVMGDKEIMDLTED